MKKIIFLFFLVSMPTASYAAKWSVSGNVESVTSHNGYNIINTTIVDSPCITAGKFYWPISNPDAKDMLSIALIALSTQMKVILYYSEDTTVCKFSGTAGLSTHFKISK